MFNGKDLKKIAPFVPAVILSASYFYQYLYYKNFGINIANYVEVGDILLISSPVVFPAVFVFVATMIMNLILTPVHEENSKYDEFIKISTYQKFLKRLLGYLRFSSALIVLIFVCVIMKIIFIYTQHTSNDSYLYFDFLIYNFTGLVLYVIVREEFKRQYFIFYHERIQAYATNFILITFMLFFQMYKSSVVDFRKAIEKGIVGVSFKLKENNYMTNDSLVCIGQTRNYFFLYNKVNKYVQVIKAESIDEHSIHRLQ